MIHVLPIIVTKIDIVNHQSKRANKDRISDIPIIRRDR
jgi:hypothetical protein